MSTTHDNPVFSAIDKCGRHSSGCKENRDYYIGIAIKLIKNRYHYSDLGVYLKFAVVCGVAEIVEELFSLGVDIKKQEFSGKRFLHIACSSGDFNSSKVLIDRGADIRLLDGKKRTVLHRAVFSGKVEVVRLILEHLPVDLKDAVDVYGKTAFHYAAEKKFDMVQDMLRGGCNKLCVDLKNNKPFHRAVRNNNREAVNALIQCQDTVDDQNESGDTVVHVAVRFRFDDMRCLIKSNGFENACKLKNKEGLTPLLLATSINFFDTRILLPVSNVREVDPFGRTPLHYAALHCNVDLVEQLIAHDKTMVTACDINRVTPMHMAICSTNVGDCKKTMGILRQNGYELKDDCRPHLFETVICHRNVQALGFLLCNGMSVHSIIDSDGNTPRQLCRNLLWAEGEDFITLQAALDEVKGGKNADSAIVVS